MQARSIRVRWAKDWRKIPQRAVQIPVLIAQGASSTLIPTVMQTAYVHSICANTAFVTYHLYPGLDHLSIVPSPPRRLRLT